MTETQGWVLILMVTVAFIRLGILLEHVRDRLAKIEYNMRPKDE